MDHRYLNWNIVVFTETTEARVRTLKLPLLVRGRFFTPFCPNLELGGQSSQAAFALESK